MLLSSYKYSTRIPTQIIFHLIGFSNSVSQAAEEFNF